MQLNSQSPDMASSKKEEQQQKQETPTDEQVRMPEPTFSSLSINISYTNEPSPVVPPNPHHPIPHRPLPRRPLPRRVFCCINLCNLFCALLKLVIILIIAVGISQFILWLIFQPNELNVHVEEATLTQFNLTTTTNNNNTKNNLLIYNLSLNISVRNPNIRVGIYYDSGEAAAFYDDASIGFQPIPIFYQRHKNTTVLNLVFSGQGLLFGDHPPAKYAAEKAEGFYNIGIKIQAIVRFKSGIFQTHHMKPKFDCRVRLPVPAAGKFKLPGFQRTKCDVYY